MGADSLAENTPNFPEFICTILSEQLKLKSFDEKRLHLASVSSDRSPCLALRDIYFGTKNGTTVD
jgi:hypothetical protein